MEDQLGELTRRLERAEREGRSLRRMLRVLFGVALAAALGVATLMAAGPAETQNATRSFQAPFRVVDQRGKPLIEVNSDDDGPFLRLYNKEGREVALLFADKDGGNFGIATGEGKPVAVLFADEDGGNLTLNDRAGTQMGALISTQQGGRLDVYDKGGNVVRRVP